MIHLFLIVPALAGVVIGFYIYKDDKNIWLALIGTMVGAMAFFMFSVLIYGIVVTSPYSNQVEFIRLEEVPYIVKITEPDDGWIKDNFDLLKKYEFIEVAE